ncbi:MAG: glycoside hydrolase family 127 protein [Chloroflexi bacterium]|nr:glycoside hydrolase family 127 protein [Chloroflexota bacterium]
MQEPSIKQTRITDGFWAKKLYVNQSSAIFHQWDQLEATHCIDNFRIAAGLKAGFREGFFFADSDAYKWLDGASRILADSPEPRLTILVNEFISILEKAQEPDGYLFTYNQIHFPGQRWVSLQIEHEYYCLGHLIEAGVSHFESTQTKNLLKISEKAADLLVREFLDSAPDFTDGHEEIEIALLRLWRVTHKSEYKSLANTLINRRGKTKGYPFKFIVQALRTASRMIKVRRDRKKYQNDNPGFNPPSQPLRNKHKVPFLAWPRFALNLLNGKYNQQNRPLKDQTRAEGHAVRFTYLQTAAAMLARENNDLSAADHLQRVWEQMVSKRMFVTGGIGALPLSEGFGRDYELDPEVAYTETCAALGSMLWNHEMSLLTRDPRYEDLFEWQLYNAASVGISQDGQSYFYNNPLTCHGGISRQGWYDIPCCPSNLSRIWASLGRCICSFEKDELRVNQFITSESCLEPDLGVVIRIKSDLPWGNTVQIDFEQKDPLTIKLMMRLPAWANSCQVTYNQTRVFPEVTECKPALPSANGLNFNAARWMSLTQTFRSGDTLLLNFYMPIRLIRQDKRVPKCGGKVAITRGPIVYCLESIDNPTDIFTAVVEPESLQELSISGNQGAFTVITAKTKKGTPLRFIPYLMWGNRGSSKMTVFVR